MPDMPGTAAPTNMPGVQDSKKAQTNILASLIPQIMNAMGGGDPYVQKTLQRQEMMSQQRVDKANLQGFMRSVAMPASGEVNPDLIMQQAELWGIGPEVAMGAIQKFQAFRQANRGGKQKYTRQMPGGGMHTINAYADDPILKGGNFQRGSMTQPPAMPMPFGSSKMGIFDKRTGQVTQGAPPEKPNLVKVPDGQNGWKFVEKTAGMSGPNNPTKGMRIKTNPDGTTEIMTGVATGGGALTPSTKSTVQKRVLESNSTYADLKATMRKYDDRFLMGRDKLGYAVDAFKEKWKVGDVTEGEKTKLAEYTAFKRDSIAALNNYIKQITGAAMSAEEATRLMKGMPNAGVGMFDGDSPTQFKAKMDGTLQALDRVTARDNYVLKNGLKSFSEVSLDSMNGIIDARVEEIEQVLKEKYPDKKLTEIETLVTHELSEEFGIRF